MIDSGTLLQGRFLVEDKIGMGGMGAVYRAVDQKFGSQVAIKETFYGDSELSGAFEREARLLNSLHHPILPHVSDYFTENGGIFLVMEYIEGDDLSELLKRGEVFTTNTVIGWALEILDGLDYLHSQNPPVIHRDIKPNNLKLTSRGKIVLLDFGMAKETTGHTVGGNSVFGYSRRYSPLEQIEGTGTDARSDIFSLGATVYHLLTRQPPPEALARASAIVAGRPDPLLSASSINPGVSESVAQILDSALALNAENRIGSAQAMSSLLRSAIETDPNTVRHNETSSTTAGIVPADEPAMLAFDDPVEITTQDPSSAGVDEKVFVTSVVSGDSFAATAGRSLQQRRVRRPARLTYALGLPLALLCVAVVLFATYRGMKDEGNSPSAVTEPAANASEELATDIPQESLKRESLDAVGTVEQSEPAANKDVMYKNSETVRRPTAQPKPVTAIKSEPEPVRTNARPEQTARSNGEARSRRVAKPAFEQPSVSSIEALMSGVPNDERRRRADERDTWTEDELRRRRQMRRQQRRQRQPF